MKKLIYTILSILFCLVLFSCKSKTIYVPVENTKTEYQDRWLKDSIYLHDSVFVERWKSNDTVFLTKEKYKTIYKEKLVKDSIFISDSIQVPYPVVEYKEVNRLNSIQSFQIWCGRILLLLIGGYGLYKLIRKKFI